MKRSTVIVLTAVLCGGAGSGRACVELLTIEAPRNPGQLPPDLFRLHLHVKPDPMVMELKLLGGNVARPVGKVSRDPQTEYLDLISAYEVRPEAHASFPERNDYAAALLFAGRYPEAVPVLLQLEHDYPGKHSTAANLGTAYELTGDLRNASRWIQAGIDRDPASLEGTEWLHLAILAAKEKLQHTPDWLDRHSVLEGQPERPRREVETALEFQLNERLYFIKSDDPVMCDLFFQAAKVTSDPAKRAYFLRQVSRFGPIRDRQMRDFIRG